MFATRGEIRQAAGHLIICGFEGTTLNAEVREILREVKPLGLILFARNIESPEQVAELGRELKSFRADDPLLLCVDQEGGRVARVRKPATEWPPMRTLGEINDPALTERLGAALARELRAMNFDIDFAPVLDVDTNPKNPIIGNRSFGADPQRVGIMGAALTRGLQGTGIGACGKHFPGHGDTDIDSHLALPTVSHDLRRLREIEWPPFAAAIAANVSAMMTAHVVVQELDPLPATLSRKILTDHLRKELKFKGVIVSDDLDMKAVADSFSVKDIAVQGINAGVDVFLACRNPVSILDLYAQLVRGAEDETVSHQTLMDAARRARNWRETYYKAPVDPSQCRTVVGCEEHAALVREIASRV